MQIFKNKTLTIKEICSWLLTSCLNGKKGYAACLQQGGNQEQNSYLLCIV